MDNWHWIRPLFRAVGHRPDFRLEGAEVARMCRPIVYVWVRDDAALYVGQSRCGLARPLSPQHHRLRAMDASDQLLIWTQPDEQTAKRLEARLIRRFKPEHNRGGSTPGGLHGPSPRPSLQVLRYRFDRLEQEVKAAQEHVADLEGESRAAWLRIIEHEKLARDDARGRRQVSADGGNAPQKTDGTIEAPG